MEKNANRRIFSSFQQQRKTYAFPRWPQDPWQHGLFNLYVMCFYMDRQWHEHICHIQSLERTDLSFQSCSTNRDNNLTHRGRSDVYGVGLVFCTLCIQEPLQRPCVWSLTQTAKQNNLSVWHALCPLKHAEIFLHIYKNIRFFMVLLLAKILGTNFIEGNTPILNLLFSVSGNSSIMQSKTSLGCKGPLKII